MLQKNLLEDPGAFQYFFDNHPDGAGIVDMDGHFLNLNTKAITMFGYTREEMLQKSLDQLLGRSGVDLTICDENSKGRFEAAIEHIEGYEIYVRLTYIPLVLDGLERGWLITFEDISSQREQSRDLSDIQEMFTFISEKSQNIISSFSADGIFTYISPTVKALLGYTPKEVIGKPAVDFNHPDDNKKLQDYRSSEWIDQDTARFTGRVRHKNGNYRWYETTVEYIRDPSGNIIQTIGVGRDISDRKEAEETIAYLAYHDTLTDLPNRRLFKRKVSRLLEEAKHGRHGLMLLDLDGFKYVNDTFGHETGDLLLIEVADRLTQAVGDKGLAARWGGDEFTVFRPNLENRAEMTSFTERIEAVITEPIFIAGHHLLITASIGVSFSPKDGNTVEALIKKADAEMYHAKYQEKSRL